MEIYRSTDKKYLDTFPLSDIGLQLDQESGEVLATAREIKYTIEYDSGIEVKRLALALDTDILPYGLVAYGERSEPEFYDIYFTAEELKALHILGLIDIGFHMDTLQKKAEEACRDYLYLDGVKILKIVPA